MPAATAAPRPCTAEERMALRAPLTGSGYHGVYLHARRRGTPRWVARPFRKLRVGAYASPREAAAAVAAWWRDRYGPGWIAHFRARRSPGWAAVGVPLGDRPEWAAGYDLLDDAWGEAGDFDGRPAARTGPESPAVWTWKGGGWVRAGGSGPGGRREVGFAAVAWPAGVPTVVHPPVEGDLFARPEDVSRAVREWVGRRRAAGTPVELLPAHLPPPLDG